MTVNNKIEIEAFTKIQNLINYYIHGGPNVETPEQLAIGVHALLLEIGVELQNLHGTKTLESDIKIDFETAKIINNLDSNEAAVLPAEKLFKLLMSGRLGEAEKLIVSIIDLAGTRKKEFETNYPIELANKRHQKNRDRKQKAIDYYKATRNLYKSKDQAAEELAKRFPGLSAETYRDALKGI